MNESKEPEEETRINMWTENEPTKNLKTKSKTYSEESIVSDMVHLPGLNNMTVQPKRRGV